VADVSRTATNGKKPSDLFKDWTLQNIQDRLKKEFAKNPGAEENQLFMDGDHWQRSEGWVGPMVAINDPLYRSTLMKIEKAFTSRNVIREIVTRHTLAVVGVEPSWAFVPRRALEADEKPSAEEQALIDEIEALFVQWWDKRKLAQLIIEAVELVMHQERAVIRAHTPPGLRDTKERDGVKVVELPTGPIDETLDFIWLERPPLANAAIVRDPQTMQEIGLLYYKEINSDGQEGEQIVEMTFLDGNDTIVRTMRGEKSVDVRLQIGKRLTMHQITQKPFISTQVRQAQRALNFALTCIPLGLTGANWLERVILNGEPPGTFEYDAGGNQKPGTFKPGPYYTGAGTTNFIRGIEMENAQTGERTLTNPSIAWRDGSQSVEPAAKGKREHYVDILDEVDQAHVLLAGEALPSGRSREQARADFKARVNQTRAVAEPMIQWIIETVVAMAEQFSGTVGRYTNVLRVAASCRLDLGPISIPERTADQTSVEKAMMARETAMERSGIVDVDAENARIASDPDAQLDTKRRQLEVIGSAVGAGAALEGAAKFVGLETKEITQLTTFPEFEDTPPNPNEIPNPPVQLVQ
jgi:hypothetical protein